MFRTAGFSAPELLIILTVVALLSGGVWLRQHKSFSSSVNSITSTPHKIIYPANDALARKSVAELSVFTSWLQRNGEKGVIGEVGWPGSGVDSAKWNSLAQRWYEEIDKNDLWTFAWASGEWWRLDYPLAIYSPSVAGGPESIAHAQAQVIETHAANHKSWHGVSAAGAEFSAPETEATSSFSSAYPGIIDHDYHYTSAQSLHFLASRGVRVIRLPFRWERIQPQLRSPLYLPEVERLKNEVGLASKEGLRVVLDLHNFGGYYLYNGTLGERLSLGTDKLTEADFVDVWQRLSAEFAGNTTILAYGLMDEPVNMGAGLMSTPAKEWQFLSQLALTGIRSRGDSTTILVSGYFYSAAYIWTQYHPQPWIVDPANNFRYEAHHYWDSSHAGHYKQSYDQENQAAAAAGY